MAPKKVVVAKSLPLSAIPKRAGAPLEGAPVSPGRGPSPKRATTPVRARTAATSTPASLIRPPALRKPSNQTPAAKTTTYAVESTESEASSADEMPVASTPPEPRAPPVPSEAPVTTPPNSTTSSASIAKAAAKPKGAKAKAGTKAPAKRGANQVSANPAVSVATPPQIQLSSAVPPEAPKTGLDDSPGSGLDASASASPVSDSSMGDEIGQHADFNGNNDELSKELEMWKARAAAMTKQVEELQVQMEESEQLWSHHQDGWRNQWDYQRACFEKELREWAPMKREDERASLHRSVLIEIGIAKKALLEHGECLKRSPISRTNRILEEEVQSIGINCEFQTQRAQTALAECEELREMFGSSSRRLAIEQQELLESQSKAYFKECQEVRESLASELKEHRDEFRREANAQKFVVMEAEMRTEAEIAQERMAASQLRSELAARQAAEAQPQDGVVSAELDSVRKELAELQMMYRDTWRVKGLDFGAKLAAVSTSPRDDREGVLLGRIRSLGDELADVSSAPSPPRTNTRCMSSPKATVFPSDSSPLMQRVQERDSAFMERIQGLSEQLSELAATSTSPSPHLRAVSSPSPSLPSPAQWVRCPPSQPSGFVGTSGESNGNGFVGSPRRVVPDYLALSSAGTVSELLRHVHTLKEASASQLAWNGCGGGAGYTHTRKQAVRALEKQMATLEHLTHEWASLLVERGCAGHQWAASLHTRTNDGTPPPGCGRSTDLQSAFATMERRLERLQRKLVDIHDNEQDGGISNRPNH